MVPTTSTQTTDRLAYSPIEAAAIIGISRAYLYELIAAGDLVTVKLGSRRLIRREALVDLLDRLELDPRPAA